jgi:hypothetical protein
VKKELQASLAKKGMNSLIKYFELSPKLDIRKKQAGQKRSKEGATKATKKRKTQNGFIRSGSNDPKEGQEGKEQEDPNLRYVPRRYSDFNSYPDAILELPFHTVVEIVQSHMPFEVLYAKKHNRVHVMDGVILPDWVHDYLSVGLKFLFHSHVKFDLVPTGWENLCNKIRWQYTIETGYKSKKRETYDPDLKAAERNFK